jgi:anion-transporting  ArsA/GET3 family ATPase
MQNTQDINTIVESLKAQYATIETRLAAITKEEAETVAKYKEQREEVLAEGRPVAQALAAFGVKVVGVQPQRKFVMSEEARQRIREGLKKAAERKRLAAAVPVTQQELLRPVAAESTPVPVPAEPTAPVKKAAARKVGRG